MQTVTARYRVDFCCMSLNFEANGMSIMRDEKVEEQRSRMGD